MLWVDDRPENNLYERRALEALGIHIDLANDSQEALRKPWRLTIAGRRAVPMIPMSYSNCRLVSCCGEDRAEDLATASGIKKRDGRMQGRAMLSDCSTSLAFKDGFSILHQRS